MRIVFFNKTIKKSVESKERKNVQKLLTNKFNCGNIKIRKILKVKIRILGVFINV